MATIFWEKIENPVRQDNVTDLNSCHGKNPLITICTVDHPPYSPDLVSSDFLLFPELKNALRGKIFLANEEAITFVNNYFAEKNAEYYFDGLRRWEHRWEKCIESQGDCVQK
ncbi:hypothetical protein QYM36_001994 [Artemia franciscana]|uniref:Histone-lysine N-methyltransferase SETMAR n=1 Tax=Artemia franciscana TaxID=6661 RepID=A0AA88LIY3_ARTSF|nr:hypothetical protein QYM36_001994 [Artemia franciscana]